jgi:hypothetical protein
MHVTVEGDVPRRGGFCVGGVAGWKITGLGLGSDPETECSGAASTVLPCDEDAQRERRVRVNRGVRVRVCDLASSPASFGHNVELSCTGAVAQNVRNR